MSLSGRLPRWSGPYDERCVDASHRARRCAPADGTRASHCHETHASQLHAPLAAMTANRFVVSARNRLAVDLLPHGHSSPDGGLPAISLNGVGQDWLREELSESGFR